MEFPIKLAMKTSSLRALSITIQTDSKAEPTTMTVKPIKLATKEKRLQRPIKGLFMHKKQLHLLHILIQIKVDRRMAAIYPHNKTIPQEANLIGEPIFSSVRFSDIFDIVSEI